MRAAMVGVVVVTGVWFEVATAEVLPPVGGPAQVRAEDAGAERILSRLRVLPGLGQWREKGRADEPRLTDRGDENTPTPAFLDPAEPPRGFEILTTRRLGTPAWMVRDRSTFTVLWEGRVRWRSGQQWGLELTSIREADVFDRTAVTPWPF